MSFNESSLRRFIITLTVAGGLALTGCGGDDEGGGNGGADGSGGSSSSGGCDSASECPEVQCPEDMFPSQTCINGVCKTQDDC